MGPPPKPATEMSGTAPSGSNTTCHCVLVFYEGIDFCTSQIVNFIFKKGLKISMELISALLKL